MHCHVSLNLERIRRFISGLPKVALAFTSGGIFVSGATSKRYFLNILAKTRGAFHLIKISENSGSGVNGKRFFSLPERKISGKSGTAQKVVPFFRLERLDWFRVPIAISW